MYPAPLRQYDESKLSGLGVGALIAAEWRTGAYSSVAAVTTAVHSKRADIPRSVIFWLAYHMVMADGAPAPDSSENQGA